MRTVTKYLLVLGVGHSLEYYLALLVGIIPVFELVALPAVEYVMSALGYELLTVGKWVFCILFINNPANILIQFFLKEHKPQTDEGIIKADSKAGRKIGSIERLIMLVFLAGDQYSAMGFVLTAKSIARYDRITKDEKFAEYYLLGTLVSTLCVMACRFLVLR